MNAFVLTGHGDEEFIKFKSRQQMPKGYTLVTFTESGGPTQLPEWTKILERMRSEPALFQDLSEKNTQEIEKILGNDVHIYTAGMKYPDLYYTSLGDYYPPAKNGEFLTFYFKSGVYKLPTLELEPLPRWEQTTEAIRDKVTGYTFPPAKTYTVYGRLSKGDDPTAARESYTGAVFPDKPTIEAILNKTNDDRFPIRDVFRALGPGVYYWVVCRGTMNDVPTNIQQRIASVRSVSRQQQRTLRAPLSGARRKRKTYRKKRREAYSK